MHVALYVLLQGLIAASSPTLQLLPRDLDALNQAIIEGKALLDLSLADKASSLLQAATTFEQAQALAYEADRNGCPSLPLDPELACPTQRLAGDNSVKPDGSTTPTTHIEVPDLCVWPPQLLLVTHLAGTARERLGSILQTQSSRDAELRGALAHFRNLFHHAPKNGLGARTLALQSIGRCLAGLRRDCEAMRAYEEVVHLHGSLEKAIEAMRNGSGPALLAASSTNCDIGKGNQVWDQLLKFGWLNVNKPSTCRSCWNKMDIARRSVGQGALADSFFNDVLQKHVPWVHAQQTPALFNSRLATAQPRPWPDSSAYGPCQLLESSKAIVLSEFEAFHDARDELGSHVFVRDHGDAALVAGDADTTVWEYLTLKEHGSWDEELCRSWFPQTCSLVRRLPEVDGQLGSSACEGYCFPESDPGPVAFYRLNAGGTVPLHSGPSNQRLKCQLVVTAPPRGETGAWLSVGGERRLMGAGDIYAFDDSYVHSAHNQGGARGDASRVVFDISFWHPDLQPR